MTKSKAGRPPVLLTAEQIIEVQTLAAFLTSEQIADYLGIARTTFYKLLRNDPDISVRYKKGRARAITNVAGGLIQQALSGNTTAAIFYLKTQAGWRETIVNENTNINKNYDMNELSNDELLKIINSE